ncbi:sugar ABC transporter permease [Treponema sp. TIM-1]|uniref:carbohydrate ABC transporter permease n=1 Tax=Treponema sp. TIM-1 TaxID=2898417 RepID=UPI00397F48D8
MKKFTLGRASAPWLLMGPAFLYYAVFWLIPVLEGIAEVFTGLEGGFTLTGNFRLMAESDLFVQSVVNTALFAGISVVLQYAIALVLAVFLNIKFKFSNFLMFIAMIPMAITPTAVAILWKTGLFKDGWINSLLMGTGLVTDPLLFMNAEGFSALLLIILIDTWTVTPSVMIILSAGLQGIEKEMREAAYTFGAGKWRIFRDITLPILRPSIMTSIILRLIAAVQVWAITVMVLGHGKVPFLVERIAFYEDIIPGLDTSGKLAFTYSFTTTVIVFAVTLVYYRISKRGTYLEVL